MNASEAGSSWFLSLLSKSENRLVSVRSFDLGIEIENRRVIVISARFVRGGGGGVGLAAGDRRILLSSSSSSPECCCRADAYKKWSRLSMGLTTIHNPAHSGINTL